MILIIYLTLMGLAIFLITFGYLYEYDQTGMVFKTIGFGIIFIIHASTLFGGIEYQSGITAIEDNVTLTTTTTYEYTEYNLHFISFIMVVLGLIGTCYFPYMGYTNWRESE